LICAGADGRIYRWKFLQAKDQNILDGEDRSFERYVGHTSVVSALVPHPFGRVFFSGDWRGQLFAWLPFDADAFRGEYDENFFGGRFFSGTSTYVKALRSADSGIVSLKLTDNGERLFLANQEGWIEAWSIRGFKRLARVRAHTGLAYDFAVNPRGDRVVSTGRDGNLVLFDLVPDQRFGIVPDTSEYSFIKLRTYSLPEARLLRWVTGDHLVAATAGGKVVDITLDQLEPSPAVELTPEPTPSASVVTEPQERDSDY
jgi:WD40 repeat protein